jgi:hypothetical protein
MAREDKVFDPHQGQATKSGAAPANRPARNGFRFACAACGALPKRKASPIPSSETAARRVDQVGINDERIL